MSVNYLKGGESPTAVLMNELFGELDKKITRLLGGRSFFLAQSWQTPQKMCGKTFFFTSGKAVYAPKVPGYIDLGGGVARPYNHQQFLSQLPTSWVGQTLQYVATANPVNGGSGYSPNDILTFFGGAGIAATYRVDLVSTGSGQIASGTLLSIGSYTTLPPANNPATGGHGTGAMFTLTFASAFDEVNKIVLVPQVTSAGYQGLPQSNYVGFFEWSLATHYLMHQGSNDTVPVKYYLQETSPTITPPVPPEKHFRFAMAEIVLEGMTHVVIEREWDKYNCFRIHNLNSSPALVSFGRDYAVNLKPFQCVAVRRDANSTNYRQTYNYFFPFTGGDPRFYWFLPTLANNLGSVSGHIGPLYVPIIGDDGRAPNSMQANNLSNPAILFDWVQFFQRTSSSSGGTRIVDPASGLPVNAGGGGTSYANFIEDPTELCDVYPFYKNYFGDPSNGSTIFGDLIHHKGDIMIIRASKTQVDPITSRPTIIFDSVRFNGYATITQDFAAKKIVVTDTGGSLQLTNGDADNNVWLISLGTNLFKTGDTNTQLVFALGTITIENAVFEDQTGVEGGSGMLTLAAGAAQSIYQPSLSTTKNYKTWYNTYNVDFHAITGLPGWDANTQYGTGEVVSSGAGWVKAIQPSIGIQPGSDPNTDAYWNPAFQQTFDNHAWFYEKFVVYGDDIQSLNWNIATRGLLQTPSILDGGSGYQNLDTFRLAGGSGDSAVLEVTSNSGGRVTGLSVVFPGNYTTLPPSPNFPGVSEYIYPDQTDPKAHHGVGLKLGNISIPLKNINGIHRVTVADILKMDWWGDPRFGDQNSNYVTITDRKLTLTPQGLVLTFTERDSSIQSSDAFLPAGFPRWTSGNRGLPRKRALKFRGHGWGYVSESVGSQTSAMLSCREDRFYARRDYQNEIMAPNGDDFTIGPLGVRALAMKMLMRIRTSQLTVSGLTGRFWKANLSADGANLLEAVASMTDHEFTSAWQAGTWANVKPGTLAMALLPEMYNAMARALNAVKSGVPLSWQCLRFNVQGTILDLDPVTLNSGRGPGTGDGFICSPGGPINSGYYSGPRPMNQFTSFYASSLYERLCQDFGIPVLTTANFPDGAKNSFPELQAKYTVPAFAYDILVTNCSDVGVAGADTTLPADDPSGAGVDVFGGHVSVTIDTDLLETKKLLKGEQTGKYCVGTYDPNDPTPPDTSGVASGRYFVASDGSGKIYISRPQTSFSIQYEPSDPAHTKGKFKETTVLGGEEVQIYSRPSPGLAAYPGGTLDLNSLAGYRWVAIEDIRQLVEGYGFKFNFNEAVIPLALKYFEDLAQVSTYGGSGSIPWSKNAFVKAVGNHPCNARCGDPFNIAPQPRVPDNWQDLEMTWVSSALGKISSGFSDSGVPGTLIKFCPTRDPDQALWKLAAQPGMQTCDVTSRGIAGPYIRFLDCIIEVQIGDTNNNGFAQFNPDINIGGNPLNPQNQWHVGDKPSARTDIPTLAIQYQAKFNDQDFSDMQATAYTEGDGFISLVDMVQTIGILRPRISASLVPIPVLMAATYVWAVQPDSWDGLDDIYQFFNHPFLQLQPVAPRVFYPKIADLTQEADSGLTIFSPPRHNQRYWVLFDLSFPAIDLQ